MKGVPTNVNEVFGKFELNGFSSTLGFFDHLKEELTIRYDNGQNFFILIYITIGKCIKKTILTLKTKFFSSIL